MYEEDELLQLSGLQHFAFCRRQWALIHIEGQWAENLRTTDGALLHERPHDREQNESRGDLLTVRGMQVRSFTLGISGACDVVEFQKCADGVPLQGRPGLWKPFPVEYKRGRPKEIDADRLQLCAQAMCLEEMLACRIETGALYYHESRRRETVSFSPELRLQVRDCLAEMHMLYRRGHTPKVRPSKGCSACSVRELCLPSLMKKKSVEAYLRESLEEKT